MMRFQLRTSARQGIGESLVACGASGGSPTPAQGILSFIALEETEPAVDAHAGATTASATGTVETGDTPPEGRRFH